MGTKCAQFIEYYTRIICKTLQITPHLGEKSAELRNLHSRQQQTVRLLLPMIEVMEWCSMLRPLKPRSSQQLQDY